MINCLRFRIYPDAEQQSLIWKTIGCCRKMWNHLLDEQIKLNNELGIDRFKNTTPAHFKQDPANNFLKEVDAQALANEQLNVNQDCRKLLAISPSFFKGGELVTKSIYRGQVDGSTADD